MNELRRYSGKSKTLFKFIRTSLKAKFNRRPTDFRRWSNPDNLSCVWESRNQLIGTMIPPNSTIIEFGAGLLTLPKYIPPTCTYIPSDIIKRTPDTLICDWNSSAIPVLPVADIAIFSGVLEYIKDVPRVLNHLFHTCNSIIASYAVANDKHPQNILARRKNGWINDHTEEEFLNIFKKHNFICQEKVTWNKQSIYRFVKSPID